MTPSDHKAQQVADELALIKAQHRESGLRLQLAEAQQRAGLSHYGLGLWNLAGGHGHCGGL